jgi:curved DNA-binding protein CbpA
MSAARRTPWEVLGVPSTATFDEAAAAFERALETLGPRLVSAHPEGRLDAVHEWVALTAAWNHVAERAPH